MLTLRALETATGIVPCWETSLGGSAVAPQHDPPAAGVTFAEAEDVGRVGVTPAVDQLVVISHHAPVPARPGEQVDKRRLGVTGVLVLVDQDPAVSLAKPGDPVRVRGR